MSNVYDFNSFDSMLDEASRWIARLDRGLSPDEEARLKVFLEDPRAREQFLDLAKHWDRLDSLAKLAEVVPTVEKRPVRRHLYAAAAAMLLVAVSAGLLLFGDNLVIAPDTEIMAAAPVYETAIGEQSNLQLPDGSGVLLNTGSRISVMYSSSSRLVVLQSGEVHFNVASDPYRPFSVSAGQKLIQAVGTEFNVRLSGPERIELIVVEGSVKVAASDSLAAGVNGQGTPSLLSTGRSVAAGSIATFGSGGESIRSIDEADIDAQLSWRNGSLVFRGETLEEAIAEVERYTNIRFEFLSDDIRHRAVAGRYKAGDVDGLLDSLQANFGIAYQRVGDDKVLISGQ